MDGKVVVKRSEPRFEQRQGAGGDDVTRFSGS